MKNKPGEFVFTDDDGGEWVKYEYFKTINKIAIENKLIVEHFQQLLGVYTSTDALVKIVELQNQQATQQNIQQINKTPADATKDFGEALDRAGIGTKIPHH